MAFPTANAEVGGGGGISRLVFRVVLSKLTAATADAVALVAIDDTDEDDEEIAGVFRAIDNPPQQTHKNNQHKRSFGHGHKFL